MITAAIIVNPNAGRQNALAIAKQAACVLESQIDVGRVGEHIFLCMVGVGYDAKVV